MRVSEIAYTEFLGLLVIMWGGMFTLFMFALTAAIGLLNARGVHTIKFKYHKPAALISLTLGFIHGLRAMLSYLGY
jgi:hypothetical protein